eukprot:1195566-Prorocentrum_minimum.AAC.2
MICVRTLRKGLEGRAPVGGRPPLGCARRCASSFASFFSAFHFCATWCARLLFTSDTWRTQGTDT